MKLRRSSPEPITEQLADLVVLLWSEIPLSAESTVVARMHDEGVYEAWEDAMNANPSAIVGTPEKWAADGGEHGYGQ